VTRRFVTLTEFGDARLPMRFWAKARVAESGCWEWVGAIDRGGYGQVWAERTLRKVHRVAYEALVGLIPRELELDHLCRVRHCCNPAHLEPVTRSENNRRGLVGKLRGATLRALTHCKHGHPFDDANTRWCTNPVNGRPRRVCRACDALKQQRCRDRRTGRSAP
jgi:hypothetical protein